MTKGDRWSKKIVITVCVYHAGNGSSRQIDSSSSTYYISRCDRKFEVEVHATILSSLSIVLLLVY